MDVIACWWIGLLTYSNKSQAAITTHSCSTSTSTRLSSVPPLCGSPHCSGGMLIVDAW